MAKSICIKCGRPTNHLVIGEKLVEFYEEESTWWEKYHYQIIQCKGCDEVSFRILSTDAQRAYASEEHNYPRWDQELFPKRTVHTIPIKQLANTPPNIKKIYRETVDAINADANILGSAGIRSIIEGVCMDKGITQGEVVSGSGKSKISKSLDGKIEGLASNGLLTNENASILHELRFLGNQALHELSAPSKEELKLAINIIENVLDNIYELSHKAKKLKAVMIKRHK